jgi:hypothetical protein
MPEPASVPGPDIFLRHRGQRVHYPFGREDRNDFGAFTKLGFQGEGSAVELDEALHDRQTEAGAFLGVFLDSPERASHNATNATGVFAGPGEPGEASYRFRALKVPPRTVASRFAVSISCP